MELTIPDELLQQAKLTEREIKIEIACRLFDAGKFTLRQAGILAGMERIDMEEELLKRNIPLYRPTVEDLRKDVEGLNDRGCSLIVVSDTSPIRALFHLGLLDLLPSLFQTVIIPPAVVTELAAQRRLLPIDLSAFPFLRIVAPHDQRLLALLQEELDAGESEAITVASELHADWLLIDERRGRQIAEARGIQTTGVLGVLVRAKARGHIPEVGTLARRLRAELGFHLSDAVIDEARRLAGES